MDTASPEARLEIPRSCFAGLRARREGRNINACRQVEKYLFHTGLYSDRKQTIVRSRNHASFDEIAETALEEESAIVSKNERYKVNNANTEGPKCSNCNKLGHVASTCYLKDRKDMRVNQFSARNESREAYRDITCYNCQGKRHVAKQCRKPNKYIERQGVSRERN